MRRSILLFLLAVVVFTTGTSCNRRGCTHPAAINYDHDANKDDGSCIFPGDVTVYTGRLYVYFSGVSRPTELRINGQNYTSQLIDISGNTATPDFCNNGSYSNYVIMLPTDRAYTLYAKNADMEWNLSNITFSIVNNVAECKVLALTKDNATNANNGKTMVTFTSNMETGMRNITVYLNQDSVGKLAEWSTGNAMAFSKELAPGRYGYKATSQNGHMWADSFTITSGQQLQIQLTKANAQVAVGTANLVFYSTTARNISVFLGSQYIGKTAGIANTGNLCSAPNAVSYISQADTTYNYTATSADGQIWNGSVSANAGTGCILVELN